jgi:hypothetical protein
MSVYATSIFVIEPPQSQSNTTFLEISSSHDFALFETKNGSGYGSFCLRGAKSFYTPIRT